MEATPGKHSAVKDVAVTSEATIFLETIWQELKDNHERTCYYDGCDMERLGYGYPGEDKTSCKKHYRDMEGMQSQEKKCLYLGCDSRASNRIDGTRYIFCALHRDMLIARGLPAASVRANNNNKYRTCTVNGCDVAASYDNTTRCKQHAVSGKSDDKRRCEFENCQSTKRPTYGYEGMKKTRCHDHKMPGMSSRKLCEQQGCKKKRVVRTKGGVATHCKQRASRGACIVNAKTCIHESCNKQPVFGERETTKATHCKMHALEGFVDVKNKRCAMIGCAKLCVDSTAYCVAHGGGKKCPMECCADGGPRPQYRHPDNASWICAFGARVLMENAYMDDNNTRVRMLMKHFGRKSIMVLNQQTAFRTAIEKQYWSKLTTCCDIFFDKSVLDKYKSVADFRPDIFYKWSIGGVSYAVHVEYDESRGHEDDDERLKCIAESAGVTNRVYVIRVNGRSETSEALCTRTQAGSVVYYTVNALGKRKAREVAQAVMQRIEWISNGLAPDDEAGRRYKLLL